MLLFYLSFYSVGSDVLTWPTLVELVFSTVRGFFLTVFGGPNSKMHA